MSIFDAYDQEYNSLSRDIIRSIGELKNLSNGSEKVSSSIRHIDALISQSSDLIKQMEIEVRSHDSGTRRALGEKLSEYKKSLSSLRSDFERAKEQAQRSSLIGEKSSADRQRLLNVNDKLDRQNDMILNAHRTVMETEDVGIEIASELKRNREKIESARSKATEFSGITDSARRILSSMQRRDVQQRFIIGFIAIVLIIAIGITIYFTSNKSK